MRAGFLLVFSYYFTCNSYCQLLLTSFPDPWPGANKTAVAEDTLLNYAYITTAQTFNPHNKWVLWRINLTTNFVDSLSGTAFAPGFTTNKIIHKSGFLYLLNDRNRIEAFNLSTNTFTWLVTVDNPSFEKINDFDIQGDTLFLGGDFGGLNTVPRWSVAAVNRNTGAIITSWDPSNNGAFDFSHIKAMRHHENNLLYLGGKFNVGGKINLVAVDIAGEFITSWTPNPNDTVQDLEIMSNELHLSGHFTNTSSLARNRIARYNLSNHTLTSYNMGANGPITQIETFPGTLFLGGSFTQIGSQARTNLGSVNLSNNQPSSWNPGLIPNNQKISRIRDKIYLLNENSTFYLVYCLSPPGVSSFLLSDNNVCRGQSNIQYQVSPLPYASSYVWSYSGSGANINANSTAASISFTSAATSGILTVTPYSSCGAAGVPVTFAITVNIPPSSNAGMDTTINCYTPSVSLIGSSSSLNSIYSWSGPLSCPANCPIFQIQNGGSYILTVTDTITSCVNTDTILVYEDTLLPNVSAPPGPFLLSCSNGSLLLSGTSLTSDTELSWRQMSSQNIFPDPYLCTTAGQYFLIVQDTMNGCKDSSQILVGYDINLPNAFLVGLPDTFPNTATYFTCLVDTIVLNAGSDTSGVAISWRDITTQALLPNPTSVTQAGIYRLIVTLNNNGCADSSIFVLLAADTSQPGFQMPAQANLNCSIDSLLLDATALTPNTNILWNGPSSYSSLDPALITDTGFYSAIITNQSNGCISVDSVYVGFDSVIVVDAGTDTIICPGSTTILIGNVTGSFNQLNYLWCGQFNMPSILVQPLSDSLFTLLVTDSAGCRGADSVLISISSPLQDSLLLFSSCDGSDSGSVQVIASGGLPPYIFSLNNGPFQSSGAFNNIPYGFCQLTIMDTMGCTITDNFILNSSSSPPLVNFLVRSKNELTDTIVMVSTSIPLPDSIIWDLPTDATVLTIDATTLSVQFSDTGMKSIEMTARYDDCEIVVTKSIHIGPEDTSNATFYNQNGIKSLLFHPNPNTGQFTVALEFFREQDFVLQLIDANGIIRLQQSGQDEIFYSAIIAFQDPVPGNYFLRIVSEFDQKSMVLTIQ